MTIHKNGPKAERDRLILLKTYRALCRELGIKPLGDLALVKLGTTELDRLARDTYAKASPKQVERMKRRQDRHIAGLQKALRWVNQKMGREPRTAEFRWRWFWRDLFRKPAKRPIPFVTAAD